MPTPQKPVEAKVAPPVIPAQGAQEQAAKPPAPPPGISGAPDPAFAQDGSPKQRILSREERVEYRDQDGNLLNEEQVKALEGKVEFKTRYETRTRVVDEQGREIVNPDQAAAAAAAQAAAEKALEGAEAGQGKPAAGVAPPHPDVEGAAESTKINVDTLVKDDPIQPSQEGSKEKEQRLPKPGSEGNEATKGV